MLAFDVSRPGLAHSLSRLPLELLSFITQYLGVADALALASTCRHYYSFLTDAVYTRKMRYEVNGRTPLQWAVVRGVLATAERCLRLGADPNEHMALGSLDRASSFPHSRPLLTEAVDDGHLAMVQLLLSHGADPCSPDSNSTPFTLAATKGNLDLVRIMLSAATSDADARRIVNTIDCAGYAALHHASRDDNVSLATFLLDRGARLDARAWNGNTCLLVAVDAYAPATTALLIRAGADYMLVDYDGNDIIDKLGEPLSWDTKGALSTLAAMLSSLQKPLPTTKSSPNTSRSGLPEDLAHKLLMLGHYDAVELALDAGVAVDARSRSYRATALFEYALMPSSSGGEMAEGEDPGDDNEAIVRLLIDRGADVDFRAAYLGGTPLMMAAGAGRTDIVDALLGHGGADVGIRDKTGKLAYMYAADAGHHHVLSSSLFDQHMLHCELAARPDEIEDELDKLDWSFADNL
ncbi:ankyrin repeat domain-containing protein 50 [Microdochium nivale]|nr:ankyrin repeat domain-containing protein 50 [Microdochium nivale]